MESSKPQYATENLRFSLPLFKLVHPDDADMVAKLPALPVRTIFECYSTEGEYSVVRRTSTEPKFRTRTDSIAPVSAPGFWLGEKIAILGANPPDEAEIHRIEWHDVRQHAVFYVIRKGRISGKRFLPDELAPVHEGQYEDEQNNQL